MRGRTIEEYPLEVKREIEELVKSNYTGKMIYDWLNTKYYPEWENTHPEWIIKVRSIQNYIRFLCPEKNILSSTYIKNAAQRVDNEVEAIPNIKKAIRSFEELIDDFSEKKNLETKDVAELRRLLKEFVIANNTYTTLLMRLGILSEAPKRVEQLSLSVKMEQLREKSIKKKMDEDIIIEKSDT